MALLELTKQDLEEKLRQFAIQVSREVCVRTKRFSPNKIDHREMKWSREGMVDPNQLDTVKDSLA